jgi:hypothetical protein
VIAIKKDRRFITLHFFASKQLVIGFGSTVLRECFRHSPAETGVIIDIGFQPSIDLP